jgi:hypothetical protein
MLIDDRGRVLEVEIEVEHGMRTVSVKPHGGAARRNPGPIGSVQTVDASGKVARELTIDRAGLPAASQTATRAVVRTVDADNLEPIGDDLSRQEEEALIRGGWR